MDERYRSLLKAIREKCAEERWYGPGAANPRQYDDILEVDPHFDRHTLEMLHPNDPACFGFVYQPASETDLLETEKRLGFAIPPLLRLLYAELANGGFGPQAGIRGALHGYSGPYPSSDSTIVGSYPRSFPRKAPTRFLALQQLRDEVLLEPEEWPQQLLFFCDIGCCIDHCIGPDERIYAHAPSEHNGYYWLTRSHLTLEQWLWCWVRGEPYWF